MASFLVCCVLVLMRVEAAVGMTCPDGSDTSKYSGKISRTDDGRSCQKWSEQIPHQHDYLTDEHFPTDGSIEEAQNYCRNPDGDKAAWCYTSDPYVRNQYCTAHICEAPDVTCGGQLSDVSGIISYAYSRTSLELNIFVRDCLWTLVGTANNLIEFTILPLEITADDQCGYNYLQVYETGFNYGQFCINDSESTFVSKSHILYVRFLCYFCETRWNATYSQIKPPPGIDVMNPHCDMVLKNSDGWISSPDRDGDGLYQPVENCRWTLIVPSKGVMQIFVLWMDIELSSDCSKDYLQIYDHSKFYGRYCGDQTPYIISRSEVLYVRFVSDFENIGKGFNLTYSAFISDQGSTPSKDAANKTFNGDLLESKTPGATISADNSIKSTWSTPLNTTIDATSSCEKMKCRILRCTTSALFSLFVIKLY